MTLLSTFFLSILPTKFVTCIALGFIMQNQNPRGWLCNLVFFHLVIKILPFIIIIKTKNKKKKLNKQEHSKKKNKNNSHQPTAVNVFPFFKEQTLTWTAVDGFCTDAACLNGSEEWRALWSVINKVWERFSDFQ